MYEIIINTSVDVNWEKNLLKSDYANFYQNSQYIESVFGTIPIYISILDDKQNIVGQLGLNIIQTTVQYSGPIFNYFLKLFSNLSKRGIWLFGPIIHTNNEQEKIKILQEIFKAVDIICNKYNLIFVKGFYPPYDFLSTDQITNEFKNNDYLISKSITFLADLTESSDILFNKISRKTRGDILRGKKRGISIKEIKRRDELQNYIRLHEKWAKTKGLELSTSSYDVEKIWNNIQSGLEIFFLAYQNDEIISGLRLTQFNNIIYTHSVISSFSKNTSLGGTLLTFNALEWAKKNNFKIYDFSGGSNENLTEKEKNLLFYKQKWGGEEITHFNMVKIHKKISYKIFTILEFFLGKYHSYKANN